MPHVAENSTAPRQANVNRTATSEKRAQGFASRTLRGIVTDPTFFSVIWICKRALKGHLFVVRIHSIEIQEPGYPPARSNDALRDSPLEHFWRRELHAARPPIDIMRSIIKRIVVVGRFVDRKAVSGSIIGGDSIALCIKNRLKAVVANYNWLLDFSLHVERGNCCITIAVVAD